MFDDFRLKIYGDKYDFGSKDKTSKIRSHRSKIFEMIIFTNFKYICIYSKFPLDIG